MLFNTILRENDRLNPTAERTLCRQVCHTASTGQAKADALLPLNQMLRSMSLQDFLRQITQIKRAYGLGKGMAAPHKPILLVSLADWFELQAPTNNYLPFDEGLPRLFKENWNLLLYIYDYTCCITGHWVTNAQWWKPAISNRITFAISTACTILSLNHNLHRTFELGQIRMTDDNYTKVKKNLVESDSSIWRLTG